MATEKTARAIWEGDLMSGSGRVSTDSGVLSDEGVNWSARAEDADGVSPEELIAAAHATCVSMALSHTLAEHVMPSTESTPLPVDTRPEPLMRSPSQIARAVFSVAIVVPLCLV